MAEVGLVQFARVALDVAQATVPRYRTTFSKHQFTQPQLLAILCLMRYEDWTHREAEVRLWHRHRLVQMRTRVKNQMQAIVLNEGMRRKKGLWSKRGRAQFESLVLAPWTTRRRQDLLELLDRLDPKIDG